MQPDRRQFLKQIACAAAGGTGVLAASTVRANKNEHAYIPDDPMGVLVDLGVCVGCRQCERACQEANSLPTGSVKSYDDQSVYQQKRRPGPTELTVLNSWTGKEDGPVYAKANCVHCNYAACVSACIVGALEKQPNGSVTYDAWKCIGCRYCMVACPFQIPAYEYTNVLTPQVRKCQFCHHRTTAGQLPACVETCPRQVMVYGKRNELIALAHERIAKHPDKYIDHVYGENEVGGTSWLYLSPLEFEQVGFIKVGMDSPAELTEAIQHGVFKHWIAPIGWYGFLASMMWLTRRKEQAPPAVIEAESHEEEISTNAHGRLKELEFGSEQGGVAIAEEAPPVPKEHAKHDAHEDHAAPVNRTLNSPGVWLLLCLVITGVGFCLYRFFAGLAAATNLDQQHPWGLWIAMDVGSGIALAGGGFTTAALVHIFHREHYHAIARSALLTALLGYTFYVPGLLADIGRWYNIWHPTLPMMWQGNSVLFEVGICVMIYLNVQCMELTPIICQRLLSQKLPMPRLAKWLQLIHDSLEKIMPVLLVGGVALSTFHQSSLGNLMVIAPWKLHRLWWTPISPILFLWSAIMVGFPMVIFTILFASWALKRKPEMHVLGPLARYVSVFLFVYLGLKVGDMIVRKTYVELFEWSLQSWMWIAEMLIGVVLPLVMLPLPRVRRSPKLLAIGTFSVILGVVLNRLNVFVIGYHPPYATKTYFPSFTEFAVSIGLVAALMLVYRVAVTYLPILDREEVTAE